MLSGVTSVLVCGPILTPSSNPAIRGVNLEVVGGPTLVSINEEKTIGVFYFYNILYKRPTPYILHSFIHISDRFFLYQITDGL